MRKLIRYPHPEYKRKMKFLSILNKLPDKVLQKSLLSELDEVEVPRFIRYFFPFEIQIVDQETWLRNSRGEGSHQKYRKRQLDFVRSRIFKNILK